jgi:hypothetical protein
VAPLPVKSVIPAGSVAPMVGAEPAAGPAVEVLVGQAGVLDTILAGAGAQGLWECFAAIDDPRDRRGIRHSLASARAALRLALARWGAGQEHANPGDHLTHALAALDLDATDEAEWATDRCRSASPTWELRSLLTRLDEYARTHPERNTTPYGPPFSQRRPEPQTHHSTAWRGSAAEVRRPQ